MSFQTIIYEVDGPIARVSLNRPKQLNAYSVQMRDDLYEVLGALKDDDSIRAVIFRGAGDKAFCAGADLTEFLSAPSPVIARQVRWERDVWGRFLNLDKPLIAALQGYVLGSGIEISLCCDIRIASEDARFGLPEVGLGIIPAAGGTQTLPRAIGPARAMDVLLSARWLDAKEALKYRLVNRVIPKSNLYLEAEVLAHRIAALDPALVKAAKKAVDRGMDLPLAAGLELETRLASGL